MERRNDVTSGLHAGNINNFTCLIVWSRPRLDILVCFFIQQEPNYIA